LKLKGEDRIKTGSMRKKLIIAIMAFAWLAIPGKAFSFTADVQDISGTKYFPAVKEAIAQARKTISVVMFTVESSASKQSKPGELVGLLIEARKRGVDVRVVLDQNVDFVSCKRSTKS